MAVMLFSTEIQTSKRNCNKIPLPQRYDHKFSVQSSNWAGLQKNIGKSFTGTRTPLLHLGFSALQVRHITNYVKTKFLWHLLRQQEVEEEL